MKKIGLCLIVKNESKVIERCLNSCALLADYFYISDTGSTDGTQSIIKSWLERNNKPGMVEEVHWVNFSHNRSVALAKIKALNVVDYALMIDADEVIVFNSLDMLERLPKLKESLIYDVYDITTKLGDCVYLRPQLTSTKKEFYYRGVVHEFLDCKDEIKTRSIISDFFNKPIQDSARNQSGDKFKKDAELLSAALETEADSFLKTRYTFYLAQSLRDAGDNRRALHFYLERAKMGGWDEEVYISLLSAARIKSALKYPIDTVLQSFYAAHEILPQRLEAVHDIIRICRNTNRYRQGYVIGKAHEFFTIREDSLFLEKWIYDYGFYDEYAICSYYAGDKKTSKKFCEKILEEGKIHKSQIPRIKENLSYAKQP